MSDEYLWDRSGPPDPEIERLEETLRPLRYRRRLVRSRPNGWWAAAAAALLAAVVLSQPAPQPLATSWRVAGLEGAVRLGNRSAEVSMSLPSGRALRTGSGARVTLEAGRLGRIDLGPDSELRAATDRLVVLRRGALHAFIWSPPREFVVETPSARAVDLGCEYTLTVDSAGDGLLRVLTGWVAFQVARYEAFIPAGAACATRKGAGPGVPFYEDAPDALRAALAAFERGQTSALGNILAAARPRDGVTLWHLLTRVPASSRGAVYDRLAELITLPAGATREAVIRQDAAAIDLCWNALNLENTAWWRGWERKW
jgi:hypothetical protein